jgi:DNA polymerase I
MKGSWDLRLLTASYRREGPEELPVIQLFGRTPEGKSVVAEYWGFEPYFYCIEPSPELVAILQQDSEVRRLEPVELEVEGRKRRCFRVVLKHPWRTPEVRQRCKARGSEILAADIPFGQRFMFDLDLGACVRVHGEQVQGTYTTDLVVRAERFENIEAFSPQLKIVSFDVEQSIRDGKILVVGLAWRVDGELRHRSLLGDERTIIQGFVEFIQEEDPDVITGYNIDGFDIPVMMERAKRLGMETLQVARDYQGPTSIGDRFWRLHGRILADAWWAAKKELRPKRETLHDVAQLLGLQKSGVVGTAVIQKKSKKVGAPELEERPVFIGANVDEWWVKDREKVVSYCINDAEISLLILERVASLEKAMDMATVSRLPLDDVFNGRTSTMIDSILIRAADRAGVGVPMMRTGRGEMESIEGGYVHSIQPGLYEWVDVLDFRSMYPNIIIEKNICFTTLSPRGTVVSPSGARFLSAEQRVGLLPRILQDLMRWRDEVRAKLRDTTGEKREYYDRLQNAIKILTNAFYGVLASNFYRFTNLEIGASITAFARENIKAVIQRLESEDRTKVIYGDTDSIFFESPEKNLEGAIAVGKAVAQRYSRGGETLQFERVLETFFSHGKKKRYAGRSVWPTQEYIYRGYEIRRTDAFDLQIRAQQMVFERILERDVDGALKLAKELVQGALQGNVSLEDLVISRTVKDEETYVRPEAMSNVQAARKLEAMGFEITPGMKVSWIVTDGRRRPQQVEPFVFGRPFDGTPDYEYYARRLAQSLGYVTEVFGWDEASLLSGTTQATLFHEGFAPERGARAKPRRSEKEPKLEDFF